jgi:flagellar hook-associated protein 1 FlgK
MGALSALMDLTRNALVSNQAALEIVGNNVANQNVVGYTNEVASFSGDAVTLGNGVGGTSSESEVTAVSQRDRVLNQRVQQQTQVSAQATERNTALTQLESIFGLTSTTGSAVQTTLGTAIDSFYNSFSTLANAPTNVASMQGVLSAASSLATAFQSASSQIASTGVSLAQSAVSVVSEVNGLTSSIASLNQQIAAQSPGADAGPLEDQRQQDITNLSQYVGLDQVTTENNGITLSTTGGAVLVSGSQSFALQASATGSLVTITEPGSAANIAGTITGGQLGGLITTIQQNVTPLGSYVDELAYEIGTSVNTQNEAGVGGSGTAGTALFTVPATPTGAAGAMKVATTNPFAVASAAVGEGTSGNSNANALAALATSPLIAGESPSTFFQTVLSTLGTAVSTSTTDQAAQQATLSQLTTQQAAISGVSLDTEAASLTQYQRSYQAASQVFTIVNTLLGASINMGVETAV